jgi:ABC-type transporter Mla subunit MlaD
MEKEAEKFLQAEKTASELVQTLKQLQNEATSYKNAVKELDDVRQRLVKLIESTEKTANDTYQIIKLLKEIGAPEILKRIDELRNKSLEQFLNIIKRIEEIDKETKDKIDQFEKKVSEDFNLQAKSLENKLEEKSSFITSLISNFRTEIFTKIKNLDDKLTKEFTQQSILNNDLKKLIIYTLASSITAILLGLFLLLK